MWSLMWLLAGLGPSPRGPRRGAVLQYGRLFPPPSSRPPASDEKGREKAQVPKIEPLNLRSGIPSLPLCC